MIGMKTSTNESDLSDLSSTRAKPRQKENGQCRIFSLRARCQEKNSLMVVMVVKIVVVLAMGLRLVLILVLSAMTKLSLPYH